MSWEYQERLPKPKNQGRVEAALKLGLRRDACWAEINARRSQIEQRQQPPTEAENEGTQARDSGES